MLVPDTIIKSYIVTEESGECFRKSQSVHF